MGKITNRPEIIFKENSDKWKTWKIGELLSEKNRSIRLEDDKEYQLVTVKRRNEGVVSRGYLNGKDILVKNYFEVEEGDYIISKRQIVHGANGIVPKSLHKAVVSNEYLVATSNEYITTEYWTLISKLPNMYKKFFISSYGVDIEKLVFDVKDWKNRTITIPEVTEQKKITGLFDDLTQLISLHQKKCKKLKNLKKAMLDRLFPKDGQHTPEIRFKGFSGEWDENELGELCKVAKSGGTPTSSNKEYYDGSIPFLAIRDMTSQGKYLTRTSKTISQKGIDNSATWLIPKNTIIYSMYASVGLASINKIPLATSQAVINLILKDEVDVEYIYYYLLFYQQYIHEYIETGTQGNLNAQTVKLLRVSFPSIKEQRKISEYLQNLDTLITNHQKQVVILSNLKKSLNEKMFV